jgi:hypothetical protein
MDWGVVFECVKERYASLSMTLTMEESEVAGKVQQLAVSPSIAGAGENVDVRGRPNAFSKRRVKVRR